MITFKLNLKFKWFLQVQNEINELRGPSLKERWIYWKSISNEQLTRSATINELERLQKSFDVCSFIEALKRLRLISILL